MKINLPLNIYQVENNVICKLHIYIYIFFCKCSNEYLPLLKAQFHRKCEVRSKSTLSTGGRKKVGIICLHAVDGWRNVGYILLRTV